MRQTGTELGQWLEECCAYVHSWNWLVQLSPPRTALSNSQEPLFFWSVNPPCPKIQLFIWPFNIRKFPFVESPNYFPVVPLCTHAVRIMGLLARASPFSQNMLREKRQLAKYMLYMFCFVFVARNVIREPILPFSIFEN